MIVTLIHFLHQDWTFLWFFFIIFLQNQWNVYECNLSHSDEVWSVQVVISTVGELLYVLGNCFPYRLADTRGSLNCNVCVCMCICVCISVWCLGEPNVAVICWAGSSGAAIYSLYLDLVCTIQSHLNRHLEYDAHIWDDSCPGGVNVQIH